MKINSKTVYPYPIWGWKDDYKVDNPEYRPIEDSDFSDKDNYRYELKLTSIHPDIQKLIDEKKAINACVIDFIIIFPPPYRIWINGIRINFHRP